MQHPTSEKPCPEVEVSQHMGETVGVGPRHWEDQSKTLEGIQFNSIAMTQCPGPAIHLVPKERLGR